MLHFIKKIKYLLTIIVIIIVIILAIYLHQKLKKQKYENITYEPNDNLITIETKDTKEENTYCTIDIKGAIKNPGVYQVLCDSNISEVINLAGGLLENSDTSIINLAKKVNDEMVIIIYTKEEVKNSNIVDTVIKMVEKECVCPNIQNDGCINDEITSTIPNNENTLININIATLEELLTLPGIGEAKAKAIIKYREENTSFATIEDIQNVEGIGSKLYDEIKIYITT